MMLHLAEEVLFYLNIGLTIAKMEKPNLKKIHNLKKRSKRQEEKAFNLGDGYHADMPGSTPSSDRKMYRHMDKSEKLDAKARKLFKEKQNKEEMYSPIKKALVGDQDQLPEQLQQEILDSPTKMYDSPTKFVSPGMTPMATGGGFKMQMGSKENFSGTNFSSKDQSTMAAAPSIMKNDWGGETIEMKDQDGSPLNYGMRGQTKVERKMTRAENEQAGADKKAEQKRQYLKDAMAVAQTAGNIASSFVKPG